MATLGAWLDARHNNLLILSVLRAYEWESDNLYALSEYSSTNPQRGVCFVPRRALNVSDCEIARAYKVSGTTVEPVSFIVPRRVRVSLSQSLR